MADKKKLFRRIAAGSDNDDDDSGPVLSRTKPKAAAKGAPPRSNLRHDFVDDSTLPTPGVVRMQASAPTVQAVAAAVPASGQNPGAAAATGGEYSQDRLRALRASQLFRLSVASDGAGSGGGDAGNLGASGAPAQPPGAPVIVVDSDAAPDVDAATEEGIRRAGMLAKAKREQARRRGGGAVMIDAAEAVGPADFIPLGRRATQSTAIGEGGVSTARASHGALARLEASGVVDVDDADGPGAAVMSAARAPLPLLPPAAPLTAVGLHSNAHRQQPQQLYAAPTPYVAPLTSDPPPVLRRMRAALAGAAEQARAAAEAAEREVARVSVEVEEATAASAAARKATAATAAPAYDWYAGLRAYCDELTACLREKSGGVRALEGASEELESAVTLRRSRRRAADLADEVAELTDGAALVALEERRNQNPVRLVGCGGTLQQAAAGADREATEARRVRRQARRAKITAPLRRLSRALVAGRVVSTADLHSLSDGDISDSEVAYAAEKRRDLAAAARLSLSDVNERYATPGAVLDHFRPWKTHATYGTTYAHTLACVSLGELVAVLVRADLAAQWRLLAAPASEPREPEPEPERDASASDAPSGGGLGFAAAIAPPPLPARAAPADALSEDVSRALRQAGPTLPSESGGFEDSSGLGAAVAAAASHLSLDRFDWFRALWEYGETPLAPGVAAAHPAAQAAEERLLPQVVQASATLCLSAFLRHSYDPASLASTAVAVAALRECLEYEPDATAVTRCVAALAARLQGAVNDAALPVLLLGGSESEGERGGEWHAVDEGLPNAAGAAVVSPQLATLHPLTVLCFLELVKLVRCIAAWEFALAPALLRRLLEDQCVGAVARPLLNWAAGAARAALAAAQAPLPPDQRLAAAHGALGAVNLHGSLVAALASALPQSWRGGGSCAGLQCADAVAWLHSATALLAAAVPPGGGATTASQHPAWSAVLAAVLSPQGAGR